MGGVKTSEFGTGCTYCLGLFLSHNEMTERIKKEFEKLKCGDGAEMWFNGASDHLYELRIPKNISINLKKRLKSFQHKCIFWRLSMYKHKTLKKATWDDVEWAIKEAKELLRLLDKTVLKVESKRADWA